MKTFKTPRGTEIPLMNLQGKDYLPVAQRLVWFREEKPDWRVLTEITHLTEKGAIVKALIQDEKGNTLAVAHKYQSQAGFKNFVEKAETGAIGRALALVGFGTQFCADEFEEGEDIADAPQERRKPTPYAEIAHLQPGPYNTAKEAVKPAPSPVHQMVMGVNHTNLDEIRNYTVKFGRDKGFKFYQKPAEVWAEYAEAFRNWCEGKGKAVGQDVIELEQVIDSYVTLSEKDTDRSSDVPF